MQLGSPTGLYGAERWILALVRHLDPEKVTSIVASIKDAPDLEVPLCLEAKELGIRTKVFNSPGKINFSAVTALCRYLKREKVDILHTHGYKQDMVGLLGARLAGCKVVSTPHGWSRDAGFKLRCYEGLNRMIFPFFDAVVPLSPELFHGVGKIPFAKSRRRYIANGVDTVEIDEYKAVAPELLEWKKEGAFVIGYIGQLISRKGIDILLTAAASLDTAVDFRIALVGEGELRQDLENLASELGLSGKVRFFGFKDDRLAYLRGFDLFVLPSRLEGIPRCLMEAMAAGVPVLSSDISGSRDLVQHNRTGRLFRADDAGDLQRQLTHVMQNPEKITACCAHARAVVHGKFSAKLMAERYERLFGALSPAKPATDNG